MFNKKLDIAYDLNGSEKVSIWNTASNLTISIMSKFNVLMWLTYSITIKSIVCWFQCCKRSKSRILLVQFINITSKWNYMKDTRCVCITRTIDVISWKFCSSKKHVHYNMRVLGSEPLNDPNPRNQIGLHICIYDRPNQFTYDKWSLIISYLLCQQKWIL